MSTVSSLMYVSFVVIFLAVCSLNVTNATDNQEDILDVANSRAFLVKSIDELDHRHNLLDMITKPTMEQKLKSEVEKLQKVAKTDGEKRQVALLEELRQFLYGLLREDLCELEDDHLYQFNILKGMPPSSLTLVLTESLQKATQTSQDTNVEINKLDELVLDRLLQEIELCKPKWDKKFIEQLSENLGGDNELRLQEFYNHLVAFDVKRFAASEDINSPIAHDTALEGLNQFMKVLEARPKPASLLLYMNGIKEWSSKFELDENMQNVNLDKKVFGAALQNTIAPLCNKVLSVAKPMGDFYMSQILNLVWVHKQNLIENDKFQARLAQLHTKQKAPITKAMVVQAACEKLLDRKIGDNINRRLFMDITGKH